MTLFTGGAYQDKLAAARNVTGLHDAVVTEAGGSSFQELASARIIDHFHLYIRDRSIAGDSPEDILGIAEDLYRANPEVCIICNELGCGVVPADALDREVRENTGRVCCALASLSGEVYRVVCGIAVRIK